MMLLRFAECRKRFGSPYQIDKKLRGETPLTIVIFVGESQILTRCRKMGKKIVLCYMV